MDNALLVVSFVLVVRAVLVVGAGGGLAPDYNSAEQQPASGLVPQQTLTNGEVLSDVLCQRSSVHPKYLSRLRIATLYDLSLITIPSKKYQRTMMQTYDTFLTGQNITLKMILRELK